MPGQVQFAGLMPFLLEPDAKIVESLLMTVRIKPSQ